MNLITIDMESYYDKDYSLRKLTTEAYVRHPLFKVHGVGVKVGSNPTKYIYDVAKIRHLFSHPVWSDCAVLCHNTAFDGFILSHHYGVKPKFLFDTMSMGRALYPHDSASLDNLSRKLLKRQKGTELADFLGVRDLTDEQQEAMGRYCSNDVDLTYEIFTRMKQNFPIAELRIIDTTLKMFTDPILELDYDLLEDHLNTVLEKREKLLDGRDIKTLRSNDQFADLLRKLGVDPPMKVSPTTGKLTYAFAKTDEGMQALLEHTNDEVQEIAAARLGVKSSIEETRTRAFMGIAERGTLPIPLVYCGAGNTLRFSGKDKINAQNLPRGGALRHSIKAPEGYDLVVADFSAIEARMLALLAGQWDLIEIFANDKDIYCEFASKVFGRQITKEDKRERMLGKCAILGLGYGMSARAFAALLASGPFGMPPILLDQEIADTVGVRVDQSLNTEGITTKLEGAALLVHVATAKHLVDTYRGVYNNIKGYWQTCEGMLRSMHSGAVRQYGCVTTSQDRLHLPNGLSLHYQKLQKDDDNNWFYLGKRGQKTHIYSSKMAENVTQAVSRIVMTEAMNRLSGKYKIALTVHDELICCVPEEQAQQCLQDMLDAMSVSPAWAPELPLAAEGSIAKTYGEAK